jgi:hypothetical protein
MKRYLVSIHYSDWIIAGSENEAISEGWDRIIAGLIKTHEWEVNIEDEDEEYE